MYIQQLQTFATLRHKRNNNSAHLKKTAYVYECGSMKTPEILGVDK